jgi:hypothetical protein
MNLNNEELEKLQEQLILLYKFVSQHNMLKEFYYEGLEFKEPVKGDKTTINKLLELEDAEEMLQNCILEVEELKTGHKISDDIKCDKIREITKSYDLNFLFKKYGMKSLEDVGMLDIKGILSYL